jgi:hypothetical protein
MQYSDKLEKFKNNFKVTAFKPLTFNIAVDRNSHSHHEEDVDGSHRGC